MKKDIGVIKGSKCKIGKKITVAMLQSLVKKEEVEQWNKQFGTIIVDECHHIPAKTFRETISKFHSHYLYGFTATPKRKHNDEKLIYMYLGPIISEITLNQKATQENHHIIIREPGLYVPFDYKLDDYQIVSKVLIYDTARNNLIVKDILEEVKKQKRILVLTERKEHIEILSLYLKGQCEILTLSGDDSQKTKETKIKLLKDGQFQVVITTGQLLGEGLDVDNLQTLFLVYPFSFEGKLVQYLGRLYRNKSTNTIYDYRDNHIEYFEKQFKKRHSYYRKLQMENYIISNGEVGLFN